MGTLANTIGKARRSGPRFVIDTILADLDDDDRAVMLASLHNRDVSAYHIATRVTSETGHVLHAGSVTNWRNVNVAR